MRGAGADGRVEKRGAQIRGAGDQGQASLEVVGMLPLVIVVIAMLAQLFVTTHAAAQAEVAARAGARAASVAPADQTRAADTAVRDSLGRWLAPGSHNSLKAETVTVTVDVPLLFPGVPITLGAITAQATLPRS